MFAVLGILVSLALPIVLAYRSWNVILLAPICALVTTILAGSRDLPDAEVAKWQKALGAVKADGTYRRIADQYNLTKVVPIPDDRRRRFSEPVWTY